METINTASNSVERMTYIERAHQLALAIKAGERLSVLERARRLGPVLSLVPGFSFDSDSRIKLYE